MIDVCQFERPTANSVRSVEGLLYFICEREVIRLAREIKLAREQWTTDPILKKYKFTNIRRRDDRVSQWVIKHLIEPAVNSGDEHLWFTLLVARLINWPPTLQALLQAGVLPCPPAGFDASRFESVLEGLRATGVKVYSGAYMLYPTKKNPGGNKARAVAEHIIGDVVRRAPAIHTVIPGRDRVFSVEAFVETLSACFGISTFMAGQVAADLTYTGMGCSDLYSYAPIGPGSSRGLNYLLNRAPFATWSQGAFNAELIKLRTEIINKLNITDMTLHDVQNCMCEFSKYCRTVLGEGAPKSTYKPETEF